MDNDRVKHPTISDVAALAGVSTATVSRVLGHSGYVSGSARARIEAAIAELDYRPSSVAQSLKQRKTNLVGVIVRDIHHPYYPSLVHGIETQAQEYGYSMILCNGMNDIDRETKYFDYLASRSADGIIIASGSFQQKHYDYLCQSRTPIVIAHSDTMDPNIPSVSSEAREGARMAGRHLVEAGYERFAYICGPRELNTAIVRRDGFIEGVGTSDVTVVYTNSDVESGARAISELKSVLGPGLGIAATNDQTAIGAMQEAQRLGYRVADDIGFIGFDNIDLGQFTSPTLTTIDNNRHLAGMKTMQILRNIIDKNDGPRHDVVKPVLVVRGSTKRFR
ncbi:MAG: LacI family DNA-binding transcriptional regulator [Candidatus Nanopelagicales bacterium]